MKYLPSALVLGLMLQACSSPTEPKLVHVGEVHVPEWANVLFVVDNSNESMIEKQLQLGQSIHVFLEEIEKRFGANYRIGVITTGVEGPICAPCPLGDPNYRDCFNETGESGRLQDLVGRFVQTVDGYLYEWEQVEDCRVVDHDNRTCLFNAENQSGTLVVGNRGCAFERGLSAARLALGDQLEDYNAGFIREDSVLGVVVVSDEEDCGEPEDTAELLWNMNSTLYLICYQASKGEDQDGNTHDSEGYDYKLTEAAEYHRFLTDLKVEKSGLVKFAAIVGVADTEDLDSTSIEFRPTDEHVIHDVFEACTKEACGQEARYCQAYPGTRYIELARMFGIGQDGMVESICDADMERILRRIGKFMGCPERFSVCAQMNGYRELLLNGTPIPEYTCADQDGFVACDLEMAGACGAGECVSTFVKNDDLDNRGCPTITFAEHIDVCSMAVDGKLVFEVER